MTERLKERIAEEWAMLDPVDPLRGLLSDVMDVLAQPAPPPECKTEAEQTAYAFGWWKALESLRTGQPAQESVGHRVGFWCAELTCNKCYSAEFRFKHTTQQQRQWVGLTEAEIDEWPPEIHGVIRLIDAQLKEKNT